MKIALVGKGGSGKTTLAGSLARVLARKQHRVLAIDGDPNPNLALTLGLDRDTANGLRFLPSSLIEVVTAPTGQASLRMTMERGKVLDEYAAHAPDDVLLLVMGRPVEGQAGAG